MAEKDWTKYVVLGIAAILALQLLGVDVLGAIEGAVSSSGQTVAQQPAGTTIVYQTAPTSTTEKPLPVETLKVKVLDKYTMNPVQDVQVQFYAPGADVKNPNVKPLDVLTTDSEGTGTTTKMIIQTNTNYDVYLNGSSSYYDRKIENWYINYNPDTGKGTLIANGKGYVEAVAVGTFTDLSNIPEASSSINTSAGTDTIAYDESAGDGSAYFQIDIGNRKANSELHDVVLCFMDSDGDMEGDEITDITATFVSGDASIVLESNLLGYWQDAMGAGGKACVDVADVIGPGRKARYEIAMTINEANWDSGEEFEIVLDDNGDASGKQYPSRSTKATQDKVIVTVQA